MDRDRGRKVPDEAGWWMMDATWCLVPVGGLMLMVLAIIVNSVTGSVSRRREAARSAWWAGGMKGSHMYQAAPVWEPGQPVIEETIPMSETLPSETFMQDWLGQKARQRERAQKMAVKRAHERAAQENLRRSEVNAAMKKIYADLGKEFEND